MIKILHKILPNITWQEKIIVSADHEYDAAAISNGVYHTN